MLVGETLFIRNAEIERLLVGIPSEHKHIRAVIEAEGRTVVINEAALAAMVRAYVVVKTSPTIYALDLESNRLANQKAGYDQDQLLETDREQDEIRQELEELLARDII